MAEKMGAGYQKKKTRGVIQRDTIDKVHRRLRLDHEALEEMEEEQKEDMTDWLDAMIDSARGKDGKDINYFINFNKGDPPDSPNAPYHVDHPTKPAENTGRVIYTYMCKGQRASLLVRKGEAEAESSV